MVKAVIITSSHAPYDDWPGKFWHFPNIYLSRVAQTVGDWVICYQGRRGGKIGYHAVQRVERIIPDPGAADHSYAVIEPGSRLDFERWVPRFRADASPYETGLPISRGSNTSAIRLISEVDFTAILDAGLHEDAAADALPRSGPLPPGVLTDPLGMAEAAQPFVGLHETIRPQVLGNRAFRDRAFARLVKRAYGGRCAMSGLALRNGHGRPEVEAAHIVPVEAKGPDSLQNGVALSGTVHWMFDRGLLSVDGDGTILIARDSVANDIAARLLVPERRLILPPDPAAAPHPSYFKWHRETLFKG